MLFALALRMDVPDPFPPESDEVAIDKGETKAAETKKSPLEVKIDFEGIEQRVARGPLAAGNYWNLSATKGFPVYSRAGNSYYGRELDGKAEVVLYSLKDRKETVLVEGGGG